MEKEKLFLSEENTISPTWNSSILGIGIHSNHLNCGSERLPNSFFNPNWENSSMGQSDPFESALSSMVSSPETNTSCYSTPLNSPPKLNLSMIMDHQIRGNSRIPGNHFPSLSTDPGFADRAARFSSLNSQFGFRERGLEFGNFPKDQSTRFSVSPMCVNLSPNKKSARLSRSSTPENGESSVSEQIPDGEIGINGQTHANPKKRKSIPRGKGKETPSFPSAKDAKDARESEESNAKKSKVAEFSGKGKEEESENGKFSGEGNEKQAKENAKPQEPPKDYIHVRARRGQATDSHSLAERVRREKISERMKFLQDLVPGCNKVTGKAVMLDEIINYVQSLQRQVEFLSMKLATVNPRTEFNMEAFVSKENFPSRESVPHGIFPFPYEYQSPQGQGPSLHSGIPHGFGQAASQHSTIWEDDLQSFVQMGFFQNQLQNIHGTMGTSQMKIEQ